MTQVPESPFVLVDGSSYLFRAYYALPPLTTSSGFPTGAIYGVISMLRKLLSTYRPGCMAVVFDTKGGNFRHELYENYKANRSEMPAELGVQIKPLHEIIQAMGLPLLAIPGVEADDVIGTLARAAEAQGIFTVISTGDKDMAQLVDTRTLLVNTMSDQHFDRAGVIEKFGVPPERIIDYLTLVGDSVDNIPGVPGVGPKTAIKWLQQYGDLQEIVAHVEEIKGKVGENLRNALKDLPLYQQLCTIKVDVPLGIQPQELKLLPEDSEQLKKWFTELEFKTWLRASESRSTSENSTSTNSHDPTKEYDVILTQKDFDRWLKKLKKASAFTFDTETTSLNVREAELVGVSFAVEAGQAAYVPLAHDYEGAPTQLSRSDVLQALKPLLIDPKKIKIGHNLKYDLGVLANEGLMLEGPLYDTLLESYVFNSVASRHNMDDLASKYLGKETITYEDVAGKGAKQIPFNQVHLDQAGPYAAEDADVTLQLHEYFWPKLQDTPSLARVFTDIEMPLMPVLFAMESHGVLIDAKALGRQSQELGKRLKELEEETHALAGQAFNLNSPKQLQEILFEQLGLPIVQKTPTGQPSTSEAVLQKLSHEFPLPKLILEYRSLSKLKSTYTDKLPEQINSKTGRIHTSYHQAVTATGRLSSSDPNLQNIPVRTEEGRKIRQAFIAPSAHQILSLDYSQIELRIMAHLSDDPGLLNAFEKGLDIHQATAAEVFGTPLNEVTLDQRRHAKAINFGLIYGMSAFGLSEQLGIARSEAEHYMKFYFQRFPGVQGYMEKTRESARRLGYVETLFGRRLYLPDIRNKNVMKQKASERAAINAPLQGAQADIIKKAMIRIHEWLLKEAPEVKLIMQVHDELIFEVPEAEVQKVDPILRSFMESAATLKVPLHVASGWGANWDEAH